MRSRQSNSDLICGYSATKLKPPRLEKMNDKRVYLPHACHSSCMLCRALLCLHQSARQQYLRIHQWKWSEESILLTIQETTVQSYTCYFRRKSGCEESSTTSYSFFEGFEWDSPLRHARFGHLCGCGLDGAITGADLGRAGLLEPTCKRWWPISKHFNVLNSTEGSLQSV